VDSLPSESTCIFKKEGVDYMNTIKIIGILLTLVLVTVSCASVTKVSSEEHGNSIVSETASEFRDLSSNVVSVLSDGSREQSV
jgi:hypothetical protein